MPLAASIKEHGDHIYITCPVGLYEPEQSEIEAFAFASDLKSAAPNPKILWLRGQYVEADEPNRNSDLWTAGELAIKSLTPVLMPVTVMHDLRSAVGTIADAKLLTPEHDQVPRARIDTTLAIWEHRFPETAQECRLNAGQSTLMQSMECVPLDTEILTRRGWKRYDELRDGDETIGYNAEAGQSEWTTIRGVHRERNEVVSLGHGKWRVDCTERHRWLAVKGRRVGSRILFDRRPEPCRANELPAIGQLLLTAPAAVGGELPVTPEEARLIGWIAGDGAFRATKHACDAVIYQSKPDGIMAIEMALGDAGVDYSVSTRTSEHGEDGQLQTSVMHTYRPEAEPMARIWRRAELDHLTWDAFVLGLSDDAREAWLDALYQAEGNENHGSKVIAQRAGPIKDAIALAAYLCGHRPVSKMRGDRSQADSHVRLCRPRVNTEKLTTIHRGEQEVWCPVTDLGTWSMRQGEHILLTGNCLSPYYDCSACGKMLERARPDWRKMWDAHVAEHTLNGASGERSPARKLRNVTFTGVGLIFGTRGARGAMPSAHLQVEELAAMHREAHEGTTTAKRARRKNTVDIEDSKYEALVAAKSESESKVGDLTARLAEAERKIESLETAKVKAEEERDEFKTKAEKAEETARVAAMRDERLAALGTGFRAKLDKLETTSKRVKAQAATLSDEEWSARLDELEESLEAKRDAALDPKDAKKDGEKDGEKDGKKGDEDALAGLLFDRKDVQNSAVASGAGNGGAGEVTAAAGEEPTVQRRQSVMGGLIRKQPKEKAKA